MLNHETNETSTFLYDEIAKCVQTRSYYALFTNRNQFVVIDRRQIDGEGKRDEFAAFLKARNPGIKWRGR